MISGIKPLNDWQKECKDGLRNALRASVEIMGKNGAEACKHAIILMAQSAAKITPKAPNKRPVSSDINTRSEFVTVYNKDGKQSRLFKFNFDTKKSVGVGTRMSGTWAQAQKIANRGLAQRSWMWGLKNLNAGKITSRPISGVGRMITISTEKVIGYILENALSYITKILPAGWEYEIARRAGDRIMHQAKQKIEREYLREMRNVRRGGYAMGQGIQRFFVRA